MFTTKIWHKQWMHTSSYCSDCFSSLSVVFLKSITSSGADLGGGGRGAHPPPPPLEMTCGFLIQLVFCKKSGLLVLGPVHMEVGGHQVGEVPRLGGVTSLSTQSLFFSWLLSHERWGTSPRRVAWSAVPGNPLRWGKFSPCECWRWGGVMFSWAFNQYKTNWKADRMA